MINPSSNYPSPTSPQWLVDRWIPSGQKLMNGAPEGSFKTIFECALAVHIASGKPFLGEVVRQGPVSIFNEETPDNMLCSILDRFALGLSLTGMSALPIHTHSMEGFRFGRKTERDRVLRLIKTEEPILIVMDSLLAMLPSGRQALVENDSTLGEVIRDDLNALLQAAPQASILLAAHSGKPVANWPLNDVLNAHMQSLVRGHGSIVGEGCDTGYGLYKISGNPPCRFAIVTKPRRTAIPKVITKPVVYVELKEHTYGQGPSWLEEISADIIPASRLAAELVQLFKDLNDHNASELVKTFALATKKELREAIDELLAHKVIERGTSPQTYAMNPLVKQEANREYLKSLK